MSKSKWTVGPWESWGRWDKMALCVPVTNGAGKIEVRTDNATADARLIAAAPMMAEALVGALETLVNMGSGDGPMAHDIRAALKAAGLED